MYFRESVLAICIRLLYALQQGIWDNTSKSHNEESVLGSATCPSYLLKVLKYIKYCVAKVFPCQDLQAARLRSLAVPHI